MDLKVITLSEKKKMQSEKVTYCMLPFIQHPVNDKNDRDREQVVTVLGMVTCVLQIRKLRQRGATSSGRRAKVESEDWNPGSAAPGLRHTVSVIKLLNDHRAKCEIIGMGEPPKEGGQLSELRKPEPGLGKGFFWAENEGGLWDWAGENQDLVDWIFKDGVFILRTIRSPWQV